MAPKTAGENVIVENPLQKTHEQAEATFLPYGPLIQIVESFGQPEIEYAAIRKGAGLMDCPHRSVLELTGKDRLSFLNNLLTNDTKSLAPGCGCYALLLNTKGRITADMYVLNLPDRTLLELDARLIGQTCAFLNQYLFAEDVQIKDCSAVIRRFSLCGPAGAALLVRLAPPGGLALSEGLYTVGNGLLAAGGKTIPVTAFKNNLCGEPQWDLIVPADAAVVLWDGLMEHAARVNDRPGSEFNLRAVGWSAFNIARIEAGTPLFGIDFSEQTLPLELAHWYARSVHPRKGCYLGQEVVARMHVRNQSARRIVGIKIRGDAVPLAGAELRAADKTVGMVTSSCMSPLLGNVPVGLAYVESSRGGIGAEFDVYTSRGKATAGVAELPFVPAQGIA